LVKIELIVLNKALGVFPMSDKCIRFSEWQACLHYWL